MDGAYFPEQTENDDRSGMPMRSVSVNNLHISIDSFKYYRSLRGQNVNPPQPAAFKQSYLYIHAGRESHYGCVNC